MIHIKNTLSVEIFGLWHLKEISVKKDGRWFDVAPTTMKVSRQKMTQNSTDTCVRNASFNENFVAGENHIWMYIPAEAVLRFPGRGLA